MHFALAITVMDLQFELATAHLWFEESLTGESGGIDKAWSDLQNASELSNLLLNGGPYGTDYYVQPLGQPEFRAHAENVSRLIAEFARFMRQEYEQAKTGASISEVSDRNDRIFAQLESNTHELADLAQKSQTADHKQARHLIVLIVISWCLVLIGATVIGSPRKQASMGSGVLAQKIPDPVRGAIAVSAIRLERH